MHTAVQRFIVGVAILGQLVNIDLIGPFSILVNNADDSEEDHEPEVYPESDGNLKKNIREIQLTVCSLPSLNFSAISNSFG